jgi:hypothetical protein
MVLGSFAKRESDICISSDSLYYIAGIRFQHIWGVANVGGKLNKTYPDRYDVAPVSISSQQFLQNVYISFTFGVKIVENFAFELFAQLSLGKPVEWPVPSYYTGFEARRLFIFGVSVGPAFVW